MRYGRDRRQRNRDWEACRASHLTFIQVSLIQCHMGLLFMTYVPSPAGNWAVHNGGPAESENQGWQNAATFEGSTNDELHSTSTEEHLIQAEDDLGQQSRSRRWSNQDILHAEIGKVTNESACSAGVGERVSPE